MYYKIALIASVRPLEGNEAWRCYEDLKLAGHAVEVLNPSLYPGLIDDDGTVDRDMLAKFIEVFNPDYISVGPQEASSIVAKLQEEGVRGSESPYRHFVLYGYVGRNNFGDELIFHIIRTRLADRYPGSYVTLMGFGAASALERHGVASIRRDTMVEANYSLNGASGLLFIAGLLFDTNFARVGSGLVDIFQNQSDISKLAALTQLAYLNGVPTVYAGIGAGPIDLEDSYRHIKLASLTNPLYITRDQATTDFLLKAGVSPELVKQKADLAFLEEKRGLSKKVREWLSSERIEPGRYVLVALRDCHNMQPTLRAAVAKALDHAYDSYGLRAVFMNFAEEDEAIHRDVAELMERGEYAAFFGNTTDSCASLEVISASHAVLAMRLHGSILANAFEVPSIGLDYNDKIAAFYKQMGRERFLLPLSCSAQDIIRVADALERDYVGETADIKEKTEANRSIAKEALEELYSVVGSRDQVPSKQHLYSRAESLETVRLEAERKRHRCTKEELAKVNRSLKKSQAEVERMRRSTTWGVGRAATAVPRFLKRSVKRINNRSISHKEQS